MKTNPKQFNSMTTVNRNVANLATLLKSAPSIIIVGGLVALGSIRVLATLQYRSVALASFSVVASANYDRSQHRRGFFWKLRQLCRLWQPILGTIAAIVSLLLALAKMLHGS